MGTSKSGRPRKGKSVKSKTNTARKTKKEFELEEEIKILLLIAFFLLLFICNFGKIGTVGNAVSGVMFGLFGVLSYIFPIVACVLILIKIINPMSKIANRKFIFGFVMFFAVSMFVEFINGISKTLTKYDIKEIYKYGVSYHKGGGIFASSMNYLLSHYLGFVGSLIFAVILAIISLIILTERSFVRDVKHTGEKLLSMNSREKSDEDKEAFYRERALDLEEKRRLKKEKDEALRLQKLEEKQKKEDEKVLNRNKKAVGITENTTLTDTGSSDNTTVKRPSSNDMHEIKLEGFDPSTELFIDDIFETEEPYADSVVTQVNHVNHVEKPAPTILKPEKKVIEDTDADKEFINITESKVEGEYEFPPISLLKQSKGRSKSDSSSYIERTKLRLLDVFETFGVNVTAGDVTKGPTVTRFELIPQSGVKVSKVKSLADDIKLNLAVTDIRIEAPIPGKAAIGIEIPNETNEPVYLGDMIGSADFKNSKSNLSFAVGKDIYGKNIIFDIDKFPHLLIAGATGSGKSVCINTLIMSIIYKANPDDVKMIMIDPKVVELSVYNGIPHLLTPVVTDPKKAAATLNYAVNEMMERYKKFADQAVRDIDGYNEKVKSSNDPTLRKLPRIIIIVDELADLVMVAKNDVEDAICRIAQLARAAGIHLIVATQRPSVDVITGLIKANMPSRLAFAVSSGVDSRTILDMGGAEDLLGKGDMLFFPKGLKKPTRLQGGFVSDSEVNAVVEFLKKGGPAEIDESITAKIDSFASKQSNSDSSGDSLGGYDEMFVDAGRFIIEKDKASIGLLQRAFKMGFNRAARIMDQLAEAGVVGPEQGTKSREILMSMESFENFVENNM